MENTNQFDLNAAILRWREHLSQSPALRLENLAELESHLRDGVAYLQGRGLSAEEAFLISTRRLGNAPALAAEYAKLNTGEVWLNRLFWIGPDIPWLWASAWSSGFAC